MVYSEVGSVALLEVTSYPVAEVLAAGGRRMALAMDDPVEAA